MSTTLRINEALIIANRAFAPYQCVALAPQEGNGELNLSVIDRHSTRLLGRTRLSRSNYSDPATLASLLDQTRRALCAEGVQLQPWSMQA